MDNSFQFIIVFLASGSAAMLIVIAVTLIAIRKILDERLPND